MNITFEVPETEKVVQILITNDDVLERDEQLQVVIAPVEGLFPVEVIESVVAVNIADNDRELHVQRAGVVRKDFVSPAII